VKKADFMGAAWVPIRKRLPPESRDMVLVWNWAEKQAHAFPGYLALKHARMELSGQGGELSGDRRISHWMKAHPPRR
jgi:hypothetical protein